VHSYTGIDPGLLQTCDIAPNARLIRGHFPEDLPPEAMFEAITMIAVLEHFPEAMLAMLQPSCLQHLVKGGRVVLTVPSPKVDRILTVLRALRILDGMCVHEHHGFDVRQAPTIFNNMRCEVHRSFQLGLNHLFVFKKR
jgi:hypothetical protein